MTKVLVIGGAGYIGSHVVLELLEKGYEVVVFDNLSTGQKINLFENVPFIEGDILDTSALIKAMQTKPDAVIHLAAKKAVGESMEKPDFYASNNITGTINILNTMLEFNVHNIVFSSSAAVYGMPEYFPVDENGAALGSLSLRGPFSRSRNLLHLRQKIDFENLHIL